MKDWQRIEVILREYSNGCSVAGKGSGRNTSPALCPDCFNGARDAIMRVVDEAKENGSKQGIRVASAIVRVDGMLSQIKGEAFDFHKCADSLRRISDVGAA